MTCGRLLLLAVAASLNACGTPEPTAQTDNAEEAAPSPRVAASGYATRPHVRAADVTASEADGTIVVVVTLSPRTATQVYVDFTTTDGSARAGNDYVRSKGRLTFKPGMTQQNIAVTVLDDGVAEDEEWFGLSLHVAEPAVVDTSTVRLTVIDDD